MFTQKTKIFKNFLFFVQYLNSYKDITVNSKDNNVYTKNENI
jgi:hypothetical protein